MVPGLIKVDFRPTGLLEFFGRIFQLEILNGLFHGEEIRNVSLIIHVEINTCSRKAQFLHFC